MLIMKFNKFIIPMIAAAFSLTGCKAILSKINFGGNSTQEVEQPKFESYDQSNQVSREDFTDRFTQEMMDSGVVHNQTHHYESFEATTKGYSKRIATEHNYGDVSSEISTEGTQVQTIKYDSEKRVASYDVKEQGNNYTILSPHYHSTGKSNHKYAGDYRYGEGKILYSDSKSKSYAIFNMDYDSVNEEYWMDYVLYSQMSSSINMLMNYIGDPGATYYMKGSTYTVYVQQISLNDLGETTVNVSNYVTIQLSFNGAVTTLKYDRNYDYTSYYKGGERDGDYYEIVQNEYGTAEMSFKSVSVKPLDLSGYTKLD